MDYLHKLLQLLLSFINQPLLNLMLQLDLNLERLRMAVDDLLIKLARMFTKLKLQIVFLINNYDMTISVLKVGLK